MNSGEARRIAVIDDDRDLGEALARLLNHYDCDVRSYSDEPSFLADVVGFAPHCLLCDIRMGQVIGFDLAARARQFCPSLSVIFMTAWPTTIDAVDAVRRHGGLDYLEKPIDEARLIAAIDEGVAWSNDRQRVADRLGVLSRREREVFDLLVKGHANKAIADRLNIAVKTVEDHRAAVMAKTNANGLAHLMALAKIG